jgi:hypothetical protein
VTICPFRYSLSSFRYYVYVPLLFVRYYVSVTSWVRSVTICFRSVTICPFYVIMCPFRYCLSPFRYYLSVPLLCFFVTLLRVRSVTVFSLRYYVSVTSWIRSVIICLQIDFLKKECKPDCS